MARDDVLPTLTAPLRGETPVRVSKGERTRQAILDRAAARASEQGLDSLTLGGLADELAMSKSGLFAHFGSRQELQLATIEHAQKIFFAEIIEPALELPSGLERLRALCEGWLSYVDRGVFPGGCFFSRTGPEFANRPGVVRDRLYSSLGEWLALLERNIGSGKRRGEIRGDVHPKRLAFELFAIGDTASRYHSVFGRDALPRVAARAMMRDHIDSALA